MKVKILDEIMLVELDLEFEDEQGKHYVLKTVIRYYQPSDYDYPEVAIDVINFEQKHYSEEDIPSWISDNFKKWYAENCNWLLVLRRAVEREISIKKIKVS